MDWTNVISVAIQTLAILVAGGGFLWRLQMDLKLWIQQSQIIAGKVAQIEVEIKKFSEVLIDLAKQDTRLTNIEARVQELSNRLYSHIREEDKAH